MDPDQQSAQPLLGNQAADPTRTIPGYIGNRHYKLATLVRASTAAPHFFDPEIVQILAEEEKKVGSACRGDAEDARLARPVERQARPLSAPDHAADQAARAPDRRAAKGPNPNTHGLFVDGGVTPFNNPSFALLMQVAGQALRHLLAARPRQYHLRVDRHRLIPRQAVVHRSRLLPAPLKLALHSLLSMMGDTQTLALAQMQWLGECPDPWPINSEIGTLADEMPPEHRWFRFMRYDVGSRSRGSQDEARQDTDRGASSPATATWTIPRSSSRSTSLRCEAAEKQVRSSTSSRKRAQRAQAGAA